MDDLYNYSSLNIKSRQYAIDKLNEDPIQVNEHIDSLRRWVQSMPHLICPTDSNFLLRFLRVTKFDESKAKKQLDNFCTLRCPRKGCLHFYDRSIINEEIIEEYLDSGSYVPLGLNENGEMFILMKPGNWDIDRISLLQWTTLGFMVNDAFLEKEQSQIHGVWFYGDLTDTPKKVAEAWSNQDVVKSILRLFQDGSSWIYRGSVIYNAPKILEIFANMWTFYKKDCVELISIAKDEQDKIDSIPGLRSLLPTECGGHGGSLKSMTERFKHQFKDFFKKGHRMASILVDESKRHPETLDFFEEYSEYDGPKFDTNCSD